MANFDDTIQGLRRAIQNSNDIGDYYTNLPGFLQNINRELEGITEDITNILRQRQTELANIREQLRQANLMHDATQTELENARTRETDLERREADNNQALAEVRRAAQDSIARHEAEIRALRAQHDENLDRLNNEHDETLIRRLELKDNEITDRLREQEQELRQEQEELRRQIEDITNENQNLGSALDQTEAQIRETTERMNETGRTVQQLTEENTRLTNQIAEAIDGMTQATNILERIGNQDKRTVETSIATVLEHIERIHRLLNDNNQPPGSGSGPSSGPSSSTSASTTPASNQSSSFFNFASY